MTELSSIFRSEPTQPAMPSRGDILDVYNSLLAKSTQTKADKSASSVRPCAIEALNSDASKNVRKACSLKNSVPAFNQLGWLWLTRGHSMQGGSSERPTSL